MKIVVLSSGGVDSSLLMSLLRDEGKEVFPLHVDYGQHAEVREWTACNQISNHLKVHEPRRIQISARDSIISGLTDRSLDIEKDAFFPTRNLLFATLGAAYAYSLSSDVVALGLLSNPIFPDQTREFVSSAESCLESALGRHIRLLTPFIELDKRETLKLARKHQLPLDLTYYCHQGGALPCGECISCKERTVAENLLANEAD